MQNRNYLVHFFAFAMLLAAFGVSFDAWWHISLGRETFFSPPHLFIYGGTMLALVLSFILMRKTHQGIWKKIFIVLLGIPLAAPFDEAWHRFYGVEPVGSPRVVWSPPHVLLFVAAIISIALFILVILKDRDIVSRRVFGNLLLASLFNLLFIILIPLFPLGPHHVLGFWGAGFVPLLFVLINLFATEFFPGLLTATLTILFFLIFYVVFSDANTHGVKAYGYIPNWLLIFSYVVPALWIDMSKRHPIFVRAVVASLMWSLLFFGLANTYIGLNFQYTSVDFYQAVVSSILGGVVAAGLFGIFVL